MQIKNNSDSELKERLQILQEEAQLSTLRLENVERFEYDSKRDVEKTEAQLRKTKDTLRHWTEQHSKLKEHKEHIDEEIEEIKHQLERKAAFHRMWNATLELEFADGAFMVNPFIMDQRLPYWDSDVSKTQFKKISVVQGILIIDYLYTDRIPFRQMCVQDVLRLLRALDITIYVAGLSEHCNRWLQTHLQLEEYSSALLYANEHKLIKTTEIITNLIHRNFMNFVAHESAGELDSPLLCKLFLQRTDDFTELKITVPKSVFTTDLKAIITGGDLDLEVKEFRALLKKNCPSIV
jgi:hypothetical protein